MNHQIENLLQIVRQRSFENRTAGGDGFVSSHYLHFDTGLNPQTVQRTLMKHSEQGDFEHTQKARGLHLYRTKT